jgi:hypothetical protein
LRKSTVGQLVETCHLKFLPNHDVRSAPEIDRKCSPSHHLGEISCRGSRRQLADAANVTLWIVAAFEDGRDILPHYEIEIRAALEAVGIGFPFVIEDGQFKPVGVTALEGKRTGVERLIGPASWFAPG